MTIEHLHFLQEYTLVILSVVTLMPLINLRCFRCVRVFCASQLSFILSCFQIFLSRYLSVTIQISNVVAVLYVLAQHRFPSSRLCHPYFVVLILLIVSVITPVREFIIEAHKKSLEITRVTSLARFEKRVCLCKKHHLRSLYHNEIKSPLPL